MLMVSGIFNLHLSIILTGKKKIQWNPIHSKDVPTQKRNLELLGF